MARACALDHSSLVCLGALTKAISADIDAYTNRLLFGIGVLPVMVIVLFLRDWREGRTVGAESSMRL